MRDRRLVDLNFRELVNYGGQPPVRNAYSPPLACHGFCISCEESGLLEQVGGHLELTEKRDILYSLCQAFLSRNKYM